MKQIIINIPDADYRSFIKYIKRKFTGIHIEENKSGNKNAYPDSSSDDVLIFSEKSLAEDWLSDEDNRWDDVL